jgi:hypothetical protein
MLTIQQKDQNRARAIAWLPKLATQGGWTLVAAWEFLDIPPADFRFALQHVKKHFDVRVDEDFFLNRWDTPPR